MLALLLAYHYSEPAAAWLKRLAALKGEWGYAFTFAAGALAGGVSPEILTVAVFQKGRVRWQNLENLAFGIVYWGATSALTDAFYRGQALVFGGGADFLTIAKKVLVDQFGYTPFVALPLAQLCYAWKNGGYRLGPAGSTLTLYYYKNETFPAVVAAWGVWIPLVCIIYSLPSPLQVPFFSLALTFWVMIFTWINRHAPAAASRG